MPIYPSWQVPLGLLFNLIRIARGIVTTIIYSTTKRDFTLQVGSMCIMSHHQQALSKNIRVTKAHHTQAATTHAPNQNQGLPRTETDPQQQGQPKAEELRPGKSQQHSLMLRPALCCNHQSHLAAPAGGPAAPSEAWDYRSWATHRTPSGPETSSAKVWKLARSPDIKFRLFWVGRGKIVRIRGIQFLLLATPKKARGSSRPKPYATLVLNALDSDHRWLPSS